jgi:hypothetical protein
MKLRHAAALALVGWYLMVPPIGSKNGVPMVDKSAPLSQWHHRHSVYQSESDCTEALTKERDTYEAEIQAGELTMGSYIWKGQLDLETCIASDDPRLKEPSK